MEENQKLRRQNTRLVEDLRKAHIIIDVQKRVAAPLRHSIPEEAQEETSSIGTYTYTPPVLRVSFAGKTPLVSSLIRRNAARANLGSS